MNDEINQDVIEEVEMVENESENKAPKKSNFALYSLLLIAAIALVVYLFNSKNKVSDQKTGASSTPAIADLKSYTLDDISTHKGADDCWTAINGEVFDVSKFTSKHKGGDKILRVCGIDGTDLFTGKSPMGRVHSEMAAKLLSSMKIGVLK